MQSGEASAAVRIQSSANPLWNPWANDARNLELYRRRCRLQAEEMTCAAQAAEILSGKVSQGETLLDAGCGGGYYYWSFNKRCPGIDYHGLDYTPEMIELARTELCPRANLPPDRFFLSSIENLDRLFDNIICFNVLTNNPHYALPLERLLLCTKKMIVIRESLSETLITRFTADPYLDPGKQHIRVYHNTYPLDEVQSFIEDYGFSVARVVDRRTQDGVEMVVDVPHYWRILVCERNRTRGGRV